jgi:hypothetical protein
LWRSSLQCESIRFSSANSQSATCAPGAPLRRVQSEARGVGPSRRDALASLEGSNKLQSGAPPTPQWAPVNTKPARHSRSVGEVPTRVLGDGGRGRTMRLPQPTRRHYVNGDPARQRLTSTGRGRSERSAFRF